MGGTTEIVTCKNKEEFLVNFRIKLGGVALAAEATGITSKTVYEWLKVDTIFLDRFREIAHIILDEVAMDMLAYGRAERAGNYQALRYALETKLFKYTEWKIARNTQIKVARAKAPPVIVTSNDWKPDVAQLKRMLAELEAEEAAKNADPTAV